MLAAASVLVVSSAPVSADEAMPKTEQIVDARGAKPADAPSPIMPEGTPVVSFEGGAGMIGYLQGTASVGPAWNVRVTANLSNRFGIEGNYLGGYNARTVGTGHLALTAVDVDCRYNILRGHEGPVQPFLTAGAGWVSYAGLGGDMGALALPIGIGAERPMSKHFKVGARFNYRLTLLDDLGLGDFPGEPGGDTYTLLAHFGGSL